MIPSWLYVSQNYGDSGTTVITVSAGTNSDLFQRNMLIEILTVTENLTETVLVTQNKQRIGYLDVEPSAITATNEASSYTISVTSDQIWNVTYPNWITGPSSGNGNQNITINVSENSGNTRSDVITFTTTSVTATVEVTQDAYEGDYLTFEIISGGTIKLWGYAYAKVNDGAWENSGDWPMGGKSFAAGDIIRWKAFGQNFYGFNESSGTTVIFNVYGNYMSVVYSDDFRDKTTLPNDVYARGYFTGTKVIDASNLVLPATTIGDGVNSSWWYVNMFKDCSYLIIAPSILPATNLGFRCYDSMFAGCSSLTTAPELPATALTDYCYENMFNGCTNLNYIKCLAKSGISSSNTYNWVNGVASSGTFVKASGVTWPTGVDGIPNNWTVQEV